MELLVKGLYAKTFVLIGARVATMDLSALCDMLLSKGLLFGCNKGINSLYDMSLDNELVEVVESS
jgi:hypothetical protein